MITEFDTPQGFITLLIEKDNGISEKIEFTNNVLKKGKFSLAKSMIKDEPKVYINSVVFGDGGVQNGVKVRVDPEANSLYGVTRLTKPVLAQIDSENPNQIIIVFSIEKDECNDYSINEMGLKLNNGDLINMATFKDIQKDKTMRLTWTWLLVF